ncbi:DgyrCDS4635 [Dimorphilus gyrociliatus]|uniref:DgyrCDS4635 n=1 Tax=Dimorphilus gyrociliatus TaxID=2664684 RepID=A0A7I8VM79_9ANNE|nr:DgyrCDS4635 [Dimorphilus gyrociliatus]
MSGKEEKNGELRSEKENLTVVYNPESARGQRRQTFNIYLLLICILLLATSIAFGIIAFLRRTPASRECLTENCVRTATLLLDAMDPMVDPCKDFFQFACGSWNQKHVIPDDKSTFNTFEKQYDELQLKLRRLLQQPIWPVDSTAVVKAKTLYRSCINTTRIEQEGVRVLEKFLKSMGGWPVVDPNWHEDKWKLETVLTKLRKSHRQKILIRSEVGPDDKNSSMYILQIDQGDLGMPGIEYYSEKRKVFEAYHRYMIEIAILMGATPEKARREMNDVIKFEKRLAEITIPKDDRIDTSQMYDKKTVEELQKVVPQFNWLEYFNGFLLVKIDESEPVVSMATKYFVKFGDLLQNTSKRTIANYLIWRTLLRFIPDLPKKYQDARLTYKRLAMGIKRDVVRWQKCVGYINDKLGLAVGRMFVKENFKKESKESVSEMISDIREAFNEILEENDWMDEETKKVAEEKANAMKERIGYPDFILNSTKLDEFYSRIVVSENDYFQNVLNVEEFNSYETYRKLRKPVDSDFWAHIPAQVNAYYNPNTNDILFPAGILQPIFYSKNFPKSLNYGGIGVVIGHEITHGFDDKGRQYDKNGNLKQWWKNSTVKAFRDRAQCMIDQYSQYELKPFNFSINGKLTQGENIADNGGLKESFRVSNTF